MTPAYGVRAQNSPVEGIAVVGEALERVAPESAEFVVEIAAAASTAAQALHDHKNKFEQITRAVASLGVQRSDLQTISLNLVNAYAPMMQSLPYSAMPQIGTGAFGSFGGPYTGAATPLQPDVQFASYQARSLVRVNARETARVGEIVDLLTKSGATLAGGFTFRADDTVARKAVLEAAGRDARSRAEALASAAGKHLGEPISISEDIVAANGVYTAMRAQNPFAFGPGTPAAAGELEYYARVTATFRFQ